MTKKTIVIYCENYQHGGVEKFIHDLISKCDTSKYELMVIHNDSEIAYEFKHLSPVIIAKIFTTMPLFQWVSR